MRLGLLAAVSAIALTASAAHAQQSLRDAGVTVTTTPSLATDYDFRGISLTRRDPALQTTVDIAHQSGIYIGGMAGNINMPGSDARLETRLMAGYRYNMSGVRLDFGGTYHFFPGHTKPLGGRDMDWGELGVKGAYDMGPATVRGQVQYSPEFRFESGSALYVDGGVDVRVPKINIVLSGTVGHTTIRNNLRAGLPDYWNFGVAASKDVAGFVLSVGYYGTNIDKVDCMGGESICGNRVIAGVSRRF